MTEKSSMFDMFSNFAKQIKLAPPDMSAMMDAHRQNIEAISQSFAALSSGGAALAAKQQQVMQNVMAETQALVSGFNPPGTPQEIAAKQTEFARKAFEAAVENMKDSAALMQKSGSEASEIIMSRVRESVAAFNPMAKK